MTDTRTIIKMLRNKDIDIYRLTVWLQERQARTGEKVYPSQVDEALLEQAIQDDPLVRRMK